MSSTPEMREPATLHDVYRAGAKDRVAKVHGSISRLTAKDFDRGAEDWANIPQLVEFELMHRLCDRLKIKKNPTGFADVQNLAAAVLQASPIYHQFIGSTISQQQLDQKWARLQERMGDNVTFSLLCHADGMLIRFLQERESGSMTEADFDEWINSTKHEVTELFKPKE